MARNKTGARPRTTPAAASARRAAPARQRVAERPELLSPAVADRLALAAVLAVAAFMGFFRLNRDEFPSPYYAATVRSMAGSFHNFIFASFDPAGFVTVDKPPVGFWIQLLFTQVLGFHPLTVVLPQVLAGIASVGLLYHLVRRTFGWPAGFLAALALALTPVSVVVNRTNLLDPLLVLTTLLATWAVLAAIERDDPRRRLGLVLLGALAIGVGFNIKSAQVMLPVPAIFLTYLLAARESWQRRILICALAGAVIGVLAFAWPLAVDSVAESQRPFVGSTETNREMDLIIGYNTIERVSAEEDASGRSGFVAGGWLWPGSYAYGGQIGWLLPVAALGLVAAWRGRPQLPLDRRRANLLLWGANLAIQFVFFAVAEHLHTYYVVMLAPTVAALAGIGAVALWSGYRAGGPRAWLLPATLLLTFLLQLRLLNDFPDRRGDLLPAMIALCLPAAAALVLPLARRRPSGDLAGFAAIAAVTGLLVAPAVWGAIPVWNSVATWSPSAGPIRGLSVDDDPRPLTDPAARQFLEAHQGGARFAVVTREATDAGDFIAATGRSAMALGGFLGNDPILTVDEFTAKVQDGEVRYVLINPRRDLPNQRNRFQNQDSLPAASLAWVGANCAEVPWADWRSLPPPPDDPNASWRRLYDCATPTS